MSARDAGIIGGIALGGGVIGGGMVYMWQEALRTQMNENPWMFPLLGGLAGAGAGAVAGMLYTGQMPFGFGR